MLYIINHSTSLTADNKIQKCLAIAKEEDAILFIEEGVYALANPSFDKNKLQSYSNLYALKADVKARGLTDLLVSQIKLIDYEQFVELTEQHEVIQSWL